MYKYHKQPFEFLFLFHFLKKFILTGIFFFIQSQTFAQETLKLNIRHFSQKQGLGGINVRKIIKDSKGFIWAGTQDGLYRFDGKYFQEYNKLLDNNHTISGSDIRDFAIHNDTLWLISSFGGINAINTSNGNVFFSWNQQVDSVLKNVFFSSLQIDNDRLFLSGSDGLYTMDLKKRKVSKFPVKANGGYINTSGISQLFLSPDKQLWLFTAFEGVIILNTENMNLVSRKKTQAVATYSATSLRAGTVLTGTDKGLIEYTLDQKEILIGQGKIRDIPGADGNIYAVKKDKLGNIWFATKNNLIRYDPASASYKVVVENKIMEEGPWTSSIFEIFFDDTGYIWLGSQEGLAYADQDPLKFSAFYKSPDSKAILTHCYSIFPDSDSSAYVSAENGFYSVNIKTGIIHAIDNTKTYFFSFTDHQNNLVASSIEGSVIIQKGKQIPISKVYPEFSSLSSPVFNSCISMGDSVYILGTQDERGLVIWNYKRKKVSYVSENSPGLKLSNNLVNTIYRSGSGDIWILTDKSIMLYDLTKNTIRDLNIYDPVSQKNYTIFFDIAETEKYYFLASYSNGIVVIDKNYDFIREISTHQGLSNNCIYRLFNINNKTLIATSNNGLSVIDLSTYAIRRFYEESGLHSNSFEELSGSYGKEKIFAGGKGGFTIIFPDALIKQKNPPQLCIKNINILTSRKTLDTSDTDITNISIPDNALQISILLSPINYSNPERTEVYYRITEQGGKWGRLSANNVLTLIGLPPGTYHLQIQAFNEDDVPGEIKELTLVFLPKWYQTLLFKFLVVAILMTCVYLLYRMRINQFKKEKKIRSRLASDLHDDLGSTMNSVKVYASLAIMEKQADKYLPLIKEGTQDAITGIRDIIWVLDDRKDTIEDLLARINAFASPICDANAIRYKQEISDNARDHKLGQEERRNLYMMMKEAINNAIKYSDCKNIAIDISVAKGKTSIQIKDDGKGFDSTKPNEGNGLKNTQRRAKEIRYRAVIDSSAGNGTSVLFQKV